jgi:dipeptidyl aminopeptidase/acylaminoacyl peptidase
VRALLLAIALLVAAPAVARGSVLAYACGAAYENLCLAAPDGGSARALTSDGDATGATSHRYSSPALSPDGRRLAYVADTDLWIRELATGATLHGRVQSLPALIRWRRDGRRLAAAELALASSRPEVCSYAAGLTGTNEGRYCLAGGVRSGFAYRPDGRIWMTVDGGTRYGGRTVLCTLAAEGAPRTGCADDARIADPALSLESIDVSPDGALIAAVRTASGTAGAIALYDAVTGMLVRQLTDGSADGAPVFSPDGRRVAFARTDGGIWVTAVTAAPGAERRVIRQGRSPSWGPGEARAFTALSVARRQRGARVRLRLSVTVPGSRVAVRVSRAGRTLGTGARVVSGSGTQRLAVRLRAAGRRALAARGRLRVRVRVVVTPPDGAARVARRAVLLVV